MRLKNVRCAVRNHMGRHVAWLKSKLELGQIWGSEKLNGRPFMGLMVLP